MIELGFRGLNLLITVGVIAFVIYMHDVQTPSKRSVETIASVLVILTIPMTVLLAMLVAMGKWEGVFFLSALTNAFGLSMFAGYHYGRQTKGDPFETAMVAGLGSLLIFGGPLAAYFLP